MQSVQSPYFRTLVPSDSRLSNLLRSCSFIKVDLSFAEIGTDKASVVSITRLAIAPVPLRRELSVRDTGQNPAFPSPPTAEVQ